jgi:hypothetical protein
LKKENKMTIMNRVKEMKNQGLGEQQITQSLREEGASPREIDEAMDQSNVKSAVNTYDGISPRFTQEELPGSTYQQAALNPTFDTQIAEHPSEDQIDFNAQQIVPPSPNQQAFQQQQDQYQQQYQQEQGYNGQEQYSQQSSQYPQYEYNQAPQQAGSDTITELTEQIVEEKTQEIKKELIELLQFKIETQGKTDNMEDRIKRIELIIDKLQASIIGQIGNYGRNIADLKKEMIATQDSFSKIVNPLTSSIQDLREITAQIPRQAQAPQETQPKPAPAQTTSTAQTSAQQPARKEIPKKSKDFSVYLRQ